MSVFEKWTLSIGHSTIWRSFCWITVHKCSRALVSAFLDHFENSSVCLSSIRLCIGLVSGTHSSSSVDLMAPNWRTDRDYSGKWSLAIYLLRRADLLPIHRLSLSCSVSGSSTSTGSPNFKVGVYKPKLNDGSLFTPQIISVCIISKFFFRFLKLSLYFFRYSLLLVGPSPCEYHSIISSKNSMRARCLFIFLQKSLCATFFRR